MNLRFPFVILLFVLSVSPGFAVQYMFKLKMTGQSFQDECVLRYRENVTFGFDGAYDAYKIGSVNPAAPYLATRTQNNDYSINSVPVEWMNTPIAVKALVGTTGNYTINYEELDSLPAGVCVILYDSLLSIGTDIRSTGNYAAFMQSSFQGIRFSIRVVAPLWHTLLPTSCDGQSDGSIVFNNPPVPGSSFEILNSGGSSVFSYSGTDSIVAVSNLAAGTYIIQYGGTSACNLLNDTIELNTALPPVAGFSISNDTLSIQAADILVLTDTSMYADSIVWDMGDGTVYTNLDSIFHTYLTDGIYVVTQYVYYGNCADSIQQNIVVLLTVGINQKNVYSLFVNDGYYSFHLPFKPEMIELFDLRGCLLQSINPSLFSGSVQLPHHTRGTILFRFSNKDKSFTSR